MHRRDPAPWPVEIPISPEDPDWSMCFAGTPIFVNMSTPAHQLSAATRNCPETATKLPGGGHENCPLTVMGSARHDVVCLAVLRG